MKGKCFQVCANAVSTETNFKTLRMKHVCTDKERPLNGHKKQGFFFFPNECDISGSLNIFKTTNSHVEAADGELEFFCVTMVTVAIKFSTREHFHIF